MACLLQTNTAKSLTSSNQCTRVTNTYLTHITKGVGRKISRGGGPAGKKSKNSKKNIENNTIKPIPGEGGNEK